jgi:hypothetical protein
MLWGILIAGFVIIALCMESTSGKYILSFGVAAIGLAALSWITGFDLFWPLAKFCVVILIIILVIAIITSIFGK